MDSIYKILESLDTIREGFGSKREAQAYLVRVYKENDYGMTYDEWLDDIRKGDYSPALKKAVSMLDESITEATDDTRYVVAIEMYMYAKDDKDVQKQAQHFAEQLRAKYDNQAVVMSIYEQPFATMGSRKLFNKFED